MKRVKRMKHMKQMKRMKHVKQMLPQTQLYPGGLLKHPKLTTCYSTIPNKPDVGPRIYTIAGLLRQHYLLLAITNSTNHPINQFNYLSALFSVACTLLPLNSTSMAIESP